MKMKGFAGWAKERRDVPIIQRVMGTLRFAHPTVGIGNTLKDIFSWHFALLLFAGAVVIYPLLWVVSLAFSGRQSLLLVVDPPDAGLWGQLAALVPLCGC